jgi:hypothetical protein
MQDVGNSVRIVTASALELLARHNRGLHIKAHKYSAVLQRGQIVAKIANQNGMLWREVEDLGTALAQLSMAWEVRSGHL